MSLFAKNYRCNLRPPFGPWLILKLILSPSVSAVLPSVSGSWLHPFESNFPAAISLQRIAGLKLNHAPVWTPIRCSLIPKAKSPRRFPTPKFEAIFSFDQPVFSRIPFGIYSFPSCTHRNIAHLSPFHGWVIANHSTGFLASNLLQEYRALLTSVEVPKHRLFAFLFPALHMRF